MLPSDRLKSVKQSLKSPKLEVKLYHGVFYIVDAESSKVHSNIYRSAKAAEAATAKIKNGLAFFNSNGKKI